jgi:uncharacterized cupredoxin-like copper-binding protein
MARIQVVRSCAGALLGLALVGCSSSGGAGTTGAPAASAAPSSGAATDVKVTLQEWAVVPESTTLSAGNVHFAISNAGPEDTHEFVVLRTEVQAGSLPTDDTGAVDEEAEGLEVVDEVEEVPVGSGADLNVDLAAGHYVVLCNIYDEAEAESHYQLGMRTDITVQ